MRKLLDGFTKIFEILSDYPGIGDIINLVEARQLIAGLKKLPENVIGMIMNDTAVVSAKAIMDDIAQRGSDWRQALEDIGFNFWEIDDHDAAKGIVFQGSVNIIDFTDEDQGYLYIHFRGNNTADFAPNDALESHIEPFEGTWIEVYNKIVELKANYIPPSPES